MKKEELLDLINEEELRDTVELKCTVFRKLNNPYLDSEGTDSNIDSENKRKNMVDYYMLVNVRDLVKGIPTHVNPRHSNLNTATVDGIMKSLKLKDSETFHLKNRGICLSCESVVFDNKTSTATLKFSNFEQHGCIDGGHTMRAIIQANENNEIVGNHFVKIEVVTGVEDEISYISEARNKSASVDEKSMVELRGQFQVIKDMLVGEAFLERIEFKQNQFVDSDVNEIDPREVIAILNMFHLDLYPNQPGKPGFANPIQSYTSKAASLTRFKENIETYSKFKNIIVDIFKIWDTIETKFPEIYRGSYNKTRISRFNGEKTVSHALFSDKAMHYTVPRGIMYPLVASFRVLVEVDTDGNYIWKNNVSPLEKLTGICSSLVDKVFEELKRNDNPNQLGKSQNLWNLLLQEVFFYYMFN